MKDTFAKLAALSAVLTVAVTMYAPTVLAEQEGWWFNFCAYNSQGGACTATNGSGYFPDCEAGYSTGLKYFYWARNHCGEFIPEA